MHRRSGRGRPARGEPIVHLGTMGLAWPVTAALAVNVAAGVYLSAAGTSLPLETDFGRRPEPFSFLLLQGPAMIAAFGALGVLLARWVPSATAVAPAVVATFMLEMPFVWQRSSPTRWLAPLALLDSEAGEPSYLMGLHVLYLLGIAVLLGSVAALRSGRTRTSVAFAVAGGATALAGGVLQVLAA